jgi:hypothetical protein
MENTPDTVITTALSDEAVKALKGVRQLIFAKYLWSAELLTAELERQCKGFGQSYLQDMQLAHTNALSELKKANENAFAIISPHASDIKPVDWKNIVGKLVSKKDKLAHTQALNAWVKALTEAINKTLGVSAAATAQKKAKHPSQEGYKALLEHHQHVGFAALILGDLKDIDPVIGDASCEMRCPFLLDMHDAVHAYLLDKKQVDPAKKLATEFRKIHANKKYESSVRESKDIETTGADFLALVHDLEKIINRIFKGAGKYLGLCVTMTRSCAWRFDEFGTPYHFRDATTFYCVDDGKGKGEGVDQKPKLKAELADLSCAYMMQMAETLASKAAKAYQDSERQTVEDMLAKVFSTCQARKGDIKLLPIYAAFRAIILNEFAAGRPINLIVRRIKKTNEFRYSLADARTLHYVPKDLTYKYSTTIEDHDRPCFTIDAFSVTGEAPNTGDLKTAPLFKEDSDEYFSYLQAGDLATMIQIYAAGHPPFAGDATMPDESDAESYQQHLHAASRKNSSVVPALGDLTRTGWDGSTFLLEGTCDKDTNLHAEYLACRKVALAYRLNEAQQVVKQGNTVTRTASAVCFAPEHVKVLSFNQAVAECEALKKKTADKTFPRTFALTD